MATLLTLAQYRMDHDGDHMDGWGWGMGVLMVLAVVAVVVLVVWLVRSTHPATVVSGPAAASAETPRQILDRRLAAGEITPDEHRERAAMLEGS